MKSGSSNIQNTINGLGSDLRVARKRRRWTQKDMSMKMGVSLGTVQRMESGDVGVSIGTIAKALLAFGCMERLSQLIAASSDPVGANADLIHLPKRIRRRRKRSRTSDGTEYELTDDVISF